MIISFYKNIRDYKKLRLKNQCGDINIRKLGNIIIPDITDKGCEL